MINRIEKILSFRKSLFLLLVTFFVVKLICTPSHVGLTGNFNMDMEFMNAMHHFADDGIAKCGYVPIVSGGPVDHPFARLYANFPTIHFYPLSMLYHITNGSLYAHRIFSLCISIVGLWFFAQSVLLLSHDKWFSLLTVGLLATSFRFYYFYIIQLNIYIF